MLVILLSVALLEPILRGETALQVELRELFMVGLEDSGPELNRIQTRVYRATLGACQGLKRVNSVQVRRLMEG
jgi:hypothetical protein